VYLYDTASALTDIGVDYLLPFFEDNYNIYYGTAKNPQNKKKAKKGETSGQRQKQKQTQRIIINLGEELAKRGGGGDGALIHSPAPIHAVDYV
jgi:hypothetical protein